MEGGMENNINNVLRFLLISSSSERSSVMCVQDTREGVLADRCLINQITVLLKYYSTSKL